MVIFCSAGGAGSSGEETLGPRFELSARDPVEHAPDLFVFQPSTLSRGPCARVLYDICAQTLLLPLHRPRQCRQGPAFFCGCVLKMEFQVYTSTRVEVGWRAGGGRPWST
jgi:hypothetical protein